MPFNPDEYLNRAPSFDPDAFLGTKREPGYIDERHEDISFKHRLVAKNLGNDSHSQAAYLAKNYPDHEVSVGEDGEVLFKRRDETKFRRLDPSGFDLEDLSDVAYDIASGVGESAATVAGGVAGAGAGAVGAIPAAMASGGAASAGSEYLRQKLGQAAGIPQEVDTDMVKFAGIAGTASPLLLGTGAVGKQFVKQGVKEGSEELAKKLATQKGIISRGYTAAKEKIVPGMAEKLSNVEAQAYKTFVNNPGAMEVIARKGKEDFAEDTLRGLSKNLKTHKDQLGKVYDEAYNSVDTIIDVSPIRNKLNDDISGLEAQARTPLGLGADQKEKLVKLQDLKEKLFTRERVNEVGEEIAYDTGTSVPSAVIPSMRVHLNKITDYAEHPDATPIDQQIMGIAKDLNAEISKAGEEVIPGLRKVNAEYSQVMKDMEYLAEKFKNKKRMSEKYNSYVFDEKGAKAMETFHGTGKGKASVRRFIDRMDDTYGTNVGRRADMVRAHSVLYQAPWRPISAGGATSTTATINATVLGGGLGYIAGAKLSEEGAPFGSARVGAAMGSILGALGASPAVMKKLMQSGRLSEKQVKKALQRVPQRGLPLQQQQSMWNLVLNEDE